MCATVYCRLLSGCSFKGLKSMLMASLGGETDTLWNGNSPVLQQQDTKNNLNKLSIITNSASIKTFLIKMHTHTHTHTVSKRMTSFQPRFKPERNQLCQVCKQPTKSSTTKFCIKEVLKEWAREKTPSKIHAWKGKKKKRKKNTWKETHKKQFHRNSISARWLASNKNLQWCEQPWPLCWWG